MTAPDPGPSRDEVADGALERWLPGAMFPSEVLWLAARIEAAGVDTVIECGRQDGISTWTLATLLRHAGVQVLSIDFDDDRERLERVRASLDGLPVTCVSGDVHVQVPTLLREHAGGTFAVVQDGPKGWEGMATLLACVEEPDVRLVAQHNLHLGHVSRTAFEMVALRPAFLEEAATADELVATLRRREPEVLRAREPNRPLDHSSLGLIELDEPARRHASEALEVLRPITRPWDPLVVAAHWRRGDLGHVARVRSRARFGPARRKRR
jgi:hypothetical protein